MDNIYLDLILSQELVDLMMIVSLTLSCTVHTRSLFRSNLILRCTHYNGAYVSRPTAVHCQEMGVAKSIDRPIISQG